MIGNKYKDVLMISNGPYILVGVVALGVLVGVMARGFAGATYIFALLLLSAAIAGITQQTLP